MLIFEIYIDVRFVYSIHNFYRIAFFCFWIQVSSTYINLSYEMASRMKNSLDDHNRPGDYEATAICQSVIVDEIS